MTRSLQLVSFRSLVILLSIGSIFAGFTRRWALSQQAGASVAAKPATAKSKLPEITFTEVTSQFHVSLPPTSAPVSVPVSIRADEYSLDYARRTLFPAMGGSILVGDFDGDGRPDLYVIVPGGSNHLLKNRADGTFIDVTDKAKLMGSGADLSGALADFDKSGNPSLFVAGLGGVTLYHNNRDGTFSDTTEKAGIKNKPGELATSVLLVDVDNDGFLDLLVTVYTDLTVPPSKKSFVFPNDFAGANSRLYRNQHDGTFKDVTEAAGLNSNPGRTQKALAADFDHNGHMDLLFLRDNKPPVLYRNDGHGGFEDHTWDAGTEIWKYAYVDGQTADFNHDGKMDAVLWSTIGNEVILNKGNGKFEQDESLPLVYAANRAFGFHGTTADFTGDGYEDLLTVDDKGKWHLLLNRAGEFEEAPLKFVPRALEDSTQPARPFFAYLTAAHLIAPDKLELVALTMDGRVQVFERQSNSTANAAPPSKPK
jgi:hypothetical protein